MISTHPLIARSRKPRWTARPEQLDVARRVGIQLSQVNIRNAALQLIADEQIENGVAMIETANRAVVEQLEGQAGGTFQTRK